MSKKQTVGERAAEEWYSPPYTADFDNVQERLAALIDAAVREHDAGQRERVLALYKWVIARQRNAHIMLCEGTNLSPQYRAESEAYKATCCYVKKLWPADWLEPGSS